MNIVDLKEEEYFVEQYVNLRNSYADVLLTSPVNILETKEWLKKSDIEIRGIIQDNVLIGVVILYLMKKGEVAFFVRYPNKGIGNRLLKIIERVAQKRKLLYIWAWVSEDNFVAQHLFEKKGFVRESVHEKFYKGEIKRGIKYSKYLGNEE